MHSIVCSLVVVPQDNMHSGASHNIPFVNVAPGSSGGRFASTRFSLTFSPLPPTFEHLSTGNAAAETRGFISLLLAPKPLEILFLPLHVRDRAQLMLNNLQLVNPRRSVLREFQLFALSLTRAAP